MARRAIGRSLAESPLPCGILRSSLRTCASTVSRTGQAGDASGRNSREIRPFAASRGSVGRNAEMTFTRRIATRAELWFEKPQSPVRGAIPPSAGPCRQLDGHARRRGAWSRFRLAWCRPRRIDGRSGHANAGAHAIDPIGRPGACCSWRHSQREASRSPALGQPSPWQMAFQQSAAPAMDDIIWFHDFVLWIITAITVFVLVLLLIVMVKFNARPTRRRRAPPTTRCSRSPGR